MSACAYKSTTMKLLTKITAIFDGTIDFLALLAAMLLAFIMLGTVTEVAVRYLLGGSIKWMMETVEYSLLFITFLAAAWLLRSEGHVIMDVIINRLKPRTQAQTNMITSILGMVICLVVAWYGAEVTWSNFQRGIVLGTVLEPPIFIILSIIPVGSFFLSVQFLRRTYHYLRKWRESPNQEKRL